MPGEIRSAKGQGAADGKGASKADLSELREGIPAGMEKRDTTEVLQ
jgi:hypothetical protein